MRNIVLISHGGMADGVKASLEMIVGKQEHVHTVSLKPDGDNLQFSDDLEDKMKALNGPVLILADLLGGTPCNVAIKNYLEDEQVEIIAGMSLPLVIEAVVNQAATVQELLHSTVCQASDVKAKMAQKDNNATEATAEINLTDYQQFAGKANIINTRIDERLIHGQVAGIWTTSLNVQRIIVVNDEAASDPLQKTSLRMAAPTSMRLSVLSVENAVKYIQAGKYGNQRIFLLFKNPTDVLDYLEAGGQLDSVNVGNMSYKEGAIEVTKSIQVMEQEVTVFEKIADKNVKLTAQLVPNEPAIDFMKKLRG
ncbi:PTS mannose/fructose/sorbose transporter subunit IIAB [Enterococcus malodoratus]|uniref:PTS mannose/fructose/sorbose transporter subunit IIAB n=1 Tax=Enterococcus malodoratus TaxID=71451 RepID=UPI0020738AE3|nr:PTS mannose/fructose/sorbose transporter subunit IIAB [Enterococcus malodoratus]